MNTNMNNDCALLIRPLRKWISGQIEKMASMNIPTFLSHQSPFSQFESRQQQSFSEKKKNKEEHFKGTKFFPQNNKENEDVLKAMLGMDGM